MNPMKDLGPCSVTFNSIDLGATDGGVIMKHSEDTKPVKEDQQGTTEVDGIKVGKSVEIEVPLTRSSLAILAQVIGGSSYSGNRLRVRNQVGVSMLDGAALLILKPIIDGVASTDASTWLNAFKAAPRADFEIAFNNAGQRVYKVMFKVFPDSANNYKMWQIGA